MRETKKTFGVNLIIFS